MFSSLARIMEFESQTKLRKYIINRSIRNHCHLRDNDNTKEGQYLFTEENI